MIKRQKRRALKILAGLAVLTALIALATPVMVSHVPALRALHAERVLAFARDIHVITAPLAAGPLGTISIDGGTIYASEVPEGTAPHVRRMALTSAAISLNKAHPTPTAAARSVPPPPAPLPDVLMRLALDALVLKDVTLDLGGRGEPRDTLKSLSATMLANKGGVRSIQGAVDYLGKRFTFTGTLGAAGAKGPTDHALKLSAESDGISVTFDGVVDLGADPSARGALTLATNHAERTLRWLGMPVDGQSKTGRLAIHGPALWQARKITFGSATVTVDGNEGTGTLSLDLARKVPALDATLAFRRLDASAYTTAPSWLEAIQIAPAFLKAFDADLRLSIANLILGGVEYGQGAAAIALKDGMLTAEIAEIERRGVRAGGQLRLTTFGTGPPQMTIKGRMEGFDLAQAAIVPPGLRLLDGPMSIAVDLKAAGTSGPELWRTLSGRVAATLMGAGRVAVELPTRVAAASASAGIPDWQPLARGSLAIDKGEVRFALEQGIAQVDGARLQSRDQVVTFSGAVNLVAGLVDVRLRAGSEAPAVRIRGTLDRPMWRLETTADGEAAKKLSAE